MPRDARRCQPSQTCHPRYAPTTIYPVRWHPSLSASHSVGCSDCRNGLQTHRNTCSGSHAAGRLPRGSPFHRYIVAHTHHGVIHTVGLSPVALPKGQADGTLPRRWLHLSDSRDCRGHQPPKSRHGGAAPAGGQTLSVA